jgi:hypothetical protein
MKLVKNRFLLNLLSKWDFRILHGSRLTGWSGRAKRKRGIVGASVEPTDQ